jgi:hypothetical protein
MSKCWYNVQGEFVCIEGFASLPPGDYNKSCKGCTYEEIKGAILNCKCKDKDGNSIHTPSFAAKPCMASNGMINVGFDGKLFCEFPMPQGSYVSACHSCTTDAKQEVLENCQCFSFTSNAYVNAAKFNIKDCKGGNKDISANDGALICGYKLPEGEYQQTCMNCTMDSNMRYLQNCFCQNLTKDKYYLNQSFDTSNCKGQLASITNVNGFLTCAVAIPKGPAPA